eukprot:scaffold88404_cov72-Phaeocystis_antarctica.AAC.3
MDGRKPMTCTIQRPPTMRPRLASTNTALNAYILRDCRVSHRAKIMGSSSPSLSDAERFFFSVCDEALPANTIQPVIRLWRNGCTQARGMRIEAGVRTVDSPSLSRLSSRRCRPRESPRMTARRERRRGML